MSIRLRLTLLYSAILAATLLALGGGLYFTVDRISRQTLLDRLEPVARRPVEPPGRERHERFGDGRGLGDGDLLIQVMTLDGDVLSRSPSLGNATLPLSDGGLARLRAGGEWTETVLVGGEPVLLVAAPASAPGGGVAVVVGHSFLEQQQALDLLGRLLLIGGSVVLAIALGAGWLLAGTALRPIDRITQTARAIEIERNFARRVDDSGPRDEVGRLATTFNAMLAALESAYRQTDQALQAQRRFVADASHELRTPLTTIRGNLALLQRDPPIDERDRDEALADSIAECERLSRLVNDLLTLARADAGAHFATAPVDLRRLAETVCRRVQPIANGHDLRLAAGPAVRVAGHADALTQVLTILLDNALKFTPPDSAITVTVADDGRHGFVSVADRGPGIPAALLPQLFERFVRGDAARTGEGAGLGLAIARTLMDAQGGALTVESEVGRGSTFTLSLPLVPAPRLEPQPVV